MGRPPRIGGRFLPILGALLVSAGCLERPVAERLEIRFDERGGIDVSVETILTDDEDLLRNPGVAERVDAARREILAGRDLWSRRFDDLHAEREALLLERARGRLVRASRSARIEDPESIRSLFAWSDVKLFLETRDGVTEFALLPSGRPLATEKERERFFRKTEPWLSSLARWFQAVSALWEHLDARPDRAHACLGRYFRHVLDPAASAGLGAADPEEIRLVEALEEADGELVEALEIPDGQAVTLDELSEGLHDPLPARLVVKVAGEVLEWEGFTRLPSGALEARSAGLWDAFERIAARRVSPNPLAAQVAVLREPDGKPFSLEAFLTRPRRAFPAPDAGALRAELENELAPPEAYRVRFRAAP